MVSLWFTHGTGKTTMVEILQIWRMELEDKVHKVNDETVRTNLEVSAMF